MTLWCGVTIKEERSEIQLEVRFGKVCLGLNIGSSFSNIGSQGATLVLEILLQVLLRFDPKERDGLLTSKADTDTRMILQITPHTGQVNEHANTQCPQLLCWPDTRKHEHLWRIDGPP